MPELLIPGIILGVSVLIFVLMMAIVAAQWIKVARARRWPIAMGTVLESRVDEYTDSDGGLQYSPIIRYQYTIGPQVYSGDLIAFGSRSLTEGGFAGERKAHKTVAKYPKGSSVEVHHHPTSPENCVLEVRSVITKLLMFIGVAFLFAGVLIAAVVMIVNR